jgi:nucleolar complex protein 3
MGKGIKQKKRKSLSSNDRTTKTSETTEQTEQTHQRQRRRMIEEAAQETQHHDANNNNNYDIPQNNIQQNNVQTTNSSSNSVQDTCDLIAALSESILENPESAFQGQDSPEKGEPRLPSPMRQLLAIAATQNNTQNEFTAHLAIMSLLAVFKDILPSYRIRLPTEQEMAVKVSKETKKIWDYEKALLQHYQQFLKLLEGTWNRQKASQSQDGKPSRAASTAMLTMAELLKSAFAFNFGSQLLTVVVKATTTKSAIGDACCQAIEHVFVHDVQGQIAMEAARQVAKMVQKRNFQVRPAVLRTFLALPLRVHADEVEAAKLAAKAKAKKRKKDRELAEIEQEMREGDATVDKIILARAQADTLQAVTLTYFRVLKNESVPDDVLPAVLEGLAKFAHLINIDTVTDVLAVLRQLLNREKVLPLEAALNCILTAFVTLQGPGKELKIDPKEYIAPLYHQIPRLMEEYSINTSTLTEAHTHDHHQNHNSNSSGGGNAISKRNCTDLVIQCVTAAFIKRREFSVVRLCAFVKQLLTTALHTPPPTAVPLLALVRQLLQRYTAAQQLLENEQDVLTSGEYTPVAMDPEFTNPLATSGWELATLRFHWQPHIQKQAQAASTMQLLQFPAESPDRLRKDLLEDCEVLYIPFRPVIKKHPLAPSKEKKGKPRFLKARHFQQSESEKSLSQTLLG